MVDTLLFDLDGTLIDSLDDLHYCCTETFKTLGLEPITREQVALFIGKGARVLVQKALHARLGQEPSEEFVERALQEYLRAMAVDDGRYSKLEPFIEDSLAKLKSHGFTMAVVTNKTQSIAVDTLKRFKLDGYFGTIVGAGDAPHKPAPDMLILAARKLGRPLKQCVMIGDSMNDALAARNAGIGSCLLRTGYNEGMDIDLWAKTYSQGTPVFDTMRELSDYLIEQKRSLP